MSSKSKKRKIMPRYKKKGVVFDVEKKIVVDIKL